jgi:hypothetical protein
MRGDVSDKRLSARNWVYHRYQQNNSTNAHQLTATIPWTLKRIIIKDKCIFIVVFAVSKSIRFYFWTFMSFNKKSFKICFYFVLVIFIEIQKKDGQFWTCFDYNSFLCIFMFCVCVCYLFFGAGMMALSWRFL